jgi:hypothetical protein
VPYTIVDPRGDGVKLTSRHKRLFASRAANASMLTSEWCDASPLARQLRDKWTGFSQLSAGHRKRSFDASGMHDPDFSELLATCSAIVGLHPDQATGAIVDCALVLNKKFAVVPCCVFPESHPERVSRRTGRRVRTTEALVDHLRARAGSNPDGTDRANVETLPCEGANVAVWCADLPREETRTPTAAMRTVGTVDWPWPSPPSGFQTPGPFRFS